MTVPRNALSVAVGAAVQAGRIIMDGFGNVREISTKQHHDFVTEIDHRSEECIIGRIERAFPEHAILAEESGRRDKPGPCRWIIDPLDGTTNFIHGMPMFAVSIALEVDGVLEVGVVYDPAKKELFSAQRGKGAFLNERRISVSRAVDRRTCLLATGFPFRDFDLVDAYLRSFRIFMTEVAGIRRPGSAALDLAYLAAGRYDGFWELNLNPWDMAAGALLITEAGGQITGFAGGADFLDKGHVVGSNRILHAWMLASLREAFGEKINLL